MRKKFTQLDQHVLKTVTALHSRTNNIIVHLITMMGNAGVFWWILSVPFFISKTSRYIGFNILMAMFVGWIIGEVIIKSIVGRTRPSELLSQDELIIRNPRHSSFPSGHTTTSFAVAMSLCINCGPLVWIPGLIIATLISFSRIYLRVHYFSDVFAGSLIGLCCGVISKIAVEFTKLIPFIQKILG